MKYKAFTLILTLLLILPLLAYAQSGDGYNLTWSTSGGGMSSGGGFSLTGSIGQPDAGAMSGSGYRLSGGFWNAAQPSEAYRIYLPLLLR
jgi:hypothetical protein